MMKKKRFISVVFNKVDFLFIYNGKLSEMYYSVFNILQSYIILSKSNASGTVCGMVGVLSGWMAETNVNF